MRSEKKDRYYWKETSWHDCPSEKRLLAKENAKALKQEVESERKRPLNGDALLTKAEKIEIAERCRVQRKPLWSMGL